MRGLAASVRQERIAPMIKLNGPANSQIKDGTSNIQDGTSNTIVFAEALDHGHAAFTASDQITAFLQHGGDTFIWPTGAHHASAADFIL
jgi:hypothetical protein